MVHLSGLSNLSRRTVQGEGGLRLLTDLRTTALLRAAEDGWRERGDLEERLGYGGKALGNRLARLEQMGLIAARSPEHDRRRRQWVLADGGRELLDVGDQIHELSRGVAAFDGHDDAILLLRTLADTWDCAIMRLLLDGPQTFSALLRRLHGVGYVDAAGRPRRLDQGGLTRRLRCLEQLGLVCRQPAPRRGAALYAIGESAPRLGRLSVTMARWYWRWTPADSPTLAGDLLGLMKLVADQVCIADEHGGGSVMLHVHPPEGMRGWSDAHVTLAHGRIAVLDLRLGDPDASVQGTPGAWCEALLNGDFAQLELAGDASLAEALLAASATTLQI